MANETAHNNEYVSGLFLGAASEIDAIFESYRELHEIYSGSYARLEKSLDGLPKQYQKQVENAHIAFDHTAQTVRERQAEISSQLHAQGLVLLVGSAESIIREMFYVLLKLNIRKIDIKKDVDLPLKKVLKAKTDEELATLVIGMLEAEGNPTEKLNFQNAKQLQGIMKGYLGFELDDDLIVRLHKYWQIRHIVIHNASVINRRFIDNLAKAKISTDGYVLGNKIQVSKEDYKECFATLTLLFDRLDSEIERLKMRFVTA